MPAARTGQRRLSQLFANVVFPHASLHVRVYVCYDALYSAPLSKYDYLVNPANEALVGTRQPYFPVGGPVPPMVKPDKALSSSRWGGMDAGEGMLYGVQVMDGCVHDECGPELLQYLQALPEQAPFVDQVGQRVRCPVGSAIVSPAFGSLKSYFGRIIHAVPPFRSDTGWVDKLASCYLNSFRLAWPASGSSVASSSAAAAAAAAAAALSRTTTTTAQTAAEPVTVATVLLGAGCRGIAVDDAARVAADACHAFCGELLASTAASSTIPRISRGNNNDDNDDDERDYALSSHRVLHFVLREEDHCQLLLDYIKKCGARKVSGRCRP